MKSIKKKKIAMEDRVLSSISVGISWIDGRIIFKHNTKYSQAYYGICNFSTGVFAITPLDWERLTMVTTIKVSPTEDYCEKAHSCLLTTCPLNRFDKHLYAAEFKDCGLFSLGLPRSFNKETTPWFAEGEWKNFWPKFILPVTGGVLKFDEGVAKTILQE